jgi:hypothetical protein
VEERERRFMEPLKGKTPRSPNLELVSTKRQRIAELTRQAPAFFGVL